LKIIDLRNQFKTWLTLAAICGLVTYVTFFSNTQVFPPPTNSIAIVSGERAIGPYKNVEALAAAEWSPVSLPDDWRLQNVTETEAWYRFQIPKPESSSANVSLYIPTVRQNIAAFINHKWIGQGGPFTPRLAHTWNHPQLYQFSSSMLQANNTLYLKLATNKLNSGYLSNIYLGDSADLAAAWRERNFFKVTFVEISSILLIVVGLINLYLWQQRRNESYYLWYALAALCWGLRGYLLIEPVLPISNELRAALRLLTLGYGVVFVVLFNFRYFAYKRRAVDLVLWLYSVPAAIPMLFMGMDQLQTYGHEVWVKGNLLLGLITVVFLLRIYIRDHKADAIYLLFSGMPLLIVGLRDMLVLSGRWLPQEGFLINHVTLPALILAMWFILRRLSDSLTYSEELNVTLESRIKSKEREIKESYEQQQTLKRQQIVSDERERIMRDMHDGIGGYLVGIKSLMDAKAPSVPDIRNYVDLALADLRLVVNSLDVTSQNLSSLLGSMRSRWQTVAENKECKLIWDVSRTKVEHQFGPSKTLDIMRILEEAFTNSLKHGQPGNIQITSGELTEDATLWIEVINPSINRHHTAQPGRGLKNMAQRAEKIGAKLIVRESLTHHRLRLEIPLR
jgi:signal transduction histidine kinase